jgi:hypothetical protein
MERSHALASKKGTDPIFFERAEKSWGHPQKMGSVPFFQRLFFSLRPLRLCGENDLY